MNNESNEIFFIATCKGYYMGKFETFEKALDYYHENGNINLFVSINGLVLKIAKRGNDIFYNIAK